MKLCRSFCPCSVRTGTLWRGIFLFLKSIIGLPRSAAARFTSSRLELSSLTLVTIIPAAYSGLTMVAYEFKRVGKYADFVRRHCRELSCTGVLHFVCHEDEGTSTHPAWSLLVCPRFRPVGIVVVDSLVARQRLVALHAIEEALW
jgi:hypothetical protein